MNTSASEQSVRWLSVNGTWELFREFNRTTLSRNKKEEVERWTFLAKSNFLGLLPSVGSLNIRLHPPQSYRLALVVGPRCTIVRFCVWKSPTNHGGRDDEIFYDFFYWQLFYSLIQSLLKSFCVFKNSKIKNLSIY